MATREEAMTWEEYYAKFFDWSESTQIRRLSDLRTLGSHKQVAEIVTEFLDEKAATRLANKAMDAGMHFTAAEIIEMADYVSRECMNRLVTHVIGGFTPEQVDDLYPDVDEPVFDRLVRRYGSAEEALNRKLES
ncbi:MAG: hypothetical protein Q4A52_07720, partial [Bacillota bacterium]|nr:hypothetical protein [Bacillota bacterium]